jgi:2-(1,2-epoxy-1,2-dihydrophenyl)acetyl-CoA isomerase
MDTSETALLFEIRDRVAVLTMNRPDKLNALSPPMVEAAIDALQRCASDPEVGCIVLTGAGRGFCAGGDIRAMQQNIAKDMPFEQQVDRQRAVHRFSELLYTMPKVTIAAVNGPAAGAGLGLALACDLRIASDQAKLTTAFAKVGYSGDFGATWPLARMLGEAKAKELLLLSEVLAAEQARELGLLNRVMPHDELMPTVMSLAGFIAHGPLVAFRYMKENVRLASTQDYLALLNREAVTQRRCGATADHQEGVAAFLAKREPRFTGK